jgi:hypothetical protein
VYAFSVIWSSSQLCRWLGPHSFLLRMVSQPE